MKYPQHSDKLHCYHRLYSMQSKVQTFSDIALTNRVVCVALAELNPPSASHLSSIASLLSSSKTASVVTLQDFLRVHYVVSSHPLPSTLILIVWAVPL